METISWGIIGCGDVTELKSGPAFNKVPNSRLHAVMRRDIAKAKDYAERHAVPVYYDDATDLIHDPNVNAIYIATPPDSHAIYAIQAMAAGKPVYVEKPMTIDYPAALGLQAAVEKYNGKLCVAHYRNAQPFFLFIKEKIRTGVIGVSEKVSLNFHRPSLTSAEMKMPQKAWRVDPAVSGGGLFHDLAPHQLAFLLDVFGKVRHAGGISSASSVMYSAADKVRGTIHFTNDVEFEGNWNFSAEGNMDECLIKGNLGMLRFSFFGEQVVEIKIGTNAEVKNFTAPPHVQQPMIEKVVQYFLNKGPNPCPVSEGVEVMRLMEAMTKG